MATAKPAAILAALTMAALYWFAYPPMGLAQQPKVWKQAKPAARYVPQADFRPRADFTPRTGFQPKILRPN